jgi:hypothetical protein
VLTHCASVGREVDPIRDTNAIENYLGATRLVIVSARQSAERDSSERERPMRLESTHLQTLPRYSGTVRFPVK